MPKTTLSTRERVRPMSRSSLTETAHHECIACRLTYSRGCFLCLYSTDKGYVAELLTSANSGHSPAECACEAIERRTHDYLHVAKVGLLRSWRSLCIHLIAFRCDSEELRRQLRVVSKTQIYHACTKLHEDYHY